MDKKTFAIGVLSVTALILLLANSYTAHAYSVKDRDYQVVTAQAVEGGQVLYIADNRTGQVAIFSWDPAARKLVVRDRQSIGDMFVAH